MSGWLEWLSFSAAMILFGVGAVVFLTFPLFTVLVAGAVGLAWWLASGRRPSSRPGGPPRP